MSLTVKKQREMRALRAQESGGALPPAAGRVLGSLPKLSPGLTATKQLGPLLDASLAQDLKQLSAISSIESKQVFKANVLLPKYQPYVGRLTASGAKHDLLGYYLVWCFDALQFDEGLKLAVWCIDNDQTLPDRFKSTVPFFVASSLTTWAAQELAGGRSYEPYLTDAFQLMVEGNWDVDDRLKGEFFALFGRRALQEQDYFQAVGHLGRAAELGAKVKTKLEEARKHLARMQSAQTPNAAGQADQTTETILALPAGTEEG